MIVTPSADGEGLPLGIQQTQVAGGADCCGADAVQGQVEGSS